MRLPVRGSISTAVAQPLIDTAGTIRTLCPRAFSDSSTSAGMPPSRSSRLASIRCGQNDPRKWNVWMRGSSNAACRLGYHFSWNSTMLRNACRMVCS